MNSLSILSQGSQGDDGKSTRPSMLPSSSGNGATAKARSGLALSSSSSLSEWQQTTLTRMQERAQQLVNERSSVVEIREKVGSMEAKLEAKKREHANTQAAFAQQQLERYTNIQEYHKMKRKIHEQEQRSIKLRKVIAQCEQDIKEEQRYQEEAIVQGTNKTKADMPEVSSSPNDSSLATTRLENDQQVSFLDHAIKRRIYVEAMELRIRAKETASQQRQSRLDWLDEQLKRMLSHSEPEAQAELRRLELLEKTTRQATTRLIQETIPNLANRVREALAERGRLRNVLKQEEIERDEAQAIMEEAERHYLERTRAAS